MNNKLKNFAELVGGMNHIVDRCSLIVQLQGPHAVTNSEYFDSLRRLSEIIQNLLAMDSNTRIDGDTGFYKS